ncbi:hypothetical protein Anas_05974 [Armadillidium nasatum]|uniref:39S ribosomal protein L37, mitochondrial n=1 Tax=Armadillidium nasatum TaxID=96803 RepID=A0A5N5T7P3_9CRUS|nr:hypothetical protein Anas_05974 [Armadillidium nasatum]
MKIINVLRSWNLRDQFQYRWAVGRRQTIIKTKAEAILADKGIEVVDMKDVIRPVFEEEPYTPLPDKDVVIPEKKPLCYVIKNSFNPLAGLPQCQLITKTIVFDSYPDAISKKIEDCTAEEKNLWKKIVLKANLLDAEQMKLPKMLDPINYPGYRPSRQYSIPVNKQILLTIQHMFYTLNMKNSKEIMNIFHLNAKQNLFSSSRWNCSNGPSLQLYDWFQRTIRTHSLSRVHLKPHTIFVGHDPTDLGLRRIQPEFSLCQKLSGVMGDLKEPVRVNIVHTNGKAFHSGIFQLNTLDFESKRKNLFWHEPIVNIYENIKYDYTHPVVQGLNTRPYQLLKCASVHLSGVVSCEDSVVIAFTNEKVRNTSLPPKPRCLAKDNLW